MKKINITSSIKNSSQKLCGYHEKQFLWSGKCDICYESKKNVMSLESATLSSVTICKDCADRK